MEIVEFQIPKVLIDNLGDMIFYIYCGEIIECVNCGIEIDADGKAVVAIASDEKIFEYRRPDPEHDADPTDWCIHNAYVSVEEFQKTLFLKLEDAEKSLGEGSGEDGA